MSQTFVQIVERVMEFSRDEKQALLDILDRLLVEETTRKTTLPGALESQEETRGHRDPAELVSRMPADYQATEEGFGEPVGKKEW